MFDYFRDGFWHGIAYWIFHFQTLLTGIAAVGAALWTIRQVRKQMDQSETHVRKQMEQLEKHKVEDKKARNIAARAGVPKSLSRITEYNNNCLNLVWEAYDYFCSHNDSLDGFEPVTTLNDYPQDSYDEIQSLIATADSMDAQILLDYISFSQILDVRIRELAAQSTDTHRLWVDINFWSLFQDVLHGLKFTDRIFPYGRYQVENIGEFCDADEAINTLLFGHVQIVNNQEFTDFIRRNWPPRAISEHDPH